MTAHLGFLPWGSQAEAVNRSDENRAMREEGHPMTMARPKDLDVELSLVGNRKPVRSHATEPPGGSCGQTGASCPFRVGVQDSPKPMAAPAPHHAVPGVVDGQILTMFRRGMTVREIRVFLREQLRVDIDETAISAVIEPAIEPMEEWQSRHLDRMYPIVFCHALPVRIRAGGAVKSKMVHVAVGIGCDGRRDKLGIWMEEDEGAPFWQRVMGDLKNRGVEDILIVALDGLEAFPAAIATVFPKAHVQTCFLHLTRYSLSFCVAKERLIMDRELKKIFRAQCAETALQMLGEFELSAWGKKFPMIAAGWKRHWNAVVPFFDWPQEIRALLYLTRLVEIHRTELAKAIKTRGCFPDDETAVKLIYLTLRKRVKKRKRPSVKWKATALQLAIRFGNRFTAGTDSSCGRDDAGWVDPS